jgi:hypothetical protein
LPPPAAATLNQFALDTSFEAKSDFPVADVMHEARELSATLTELGTKIAKKSGADLLDISLLEEGEPSVKPKPKPKPPSTG